MKVTKPTYEQALYLGVFFLGVILRFVKLNALPLSDLEAANALQVFTAVKGGPLISSPQAGYLGFTSILFFLFGSSDWLSRLIPAIAGSLLILAPLLFRGKIGRIPAIVVSLLLAIDPFLLPLSRQAEGSILAICGGVFSLGFYLNRKMTLSGICFGLALMGGPLFWYLAVIAGCVAGWDWLLKRRQNSPSTESDNEKSELSGGMDSKRWKNWGMSAGLTVILIGTVFLTMPGAASGLFAGFSTFITGLAAEKRTEVLQMFIGWFTYSPFLWLAGLAGLVWSLKNGDEFDGYLRRIFLVAIVFLLVYPARRVVDSALISIPLAVFAARGIVSIIRIDLEDRWMVFGQAVLAATLIVSAIFSYIALFQVMQGNADQNSHIARLIAVLLLILLSLLLVGWGWSVRTSLTGLFMGVLLVTFIISFAAGMRSAGFGRDPAAELTHDGGVFTDSKLLTGTIQDISRWNRGVSNGVSITVSGLDTPGLRWAFRNEKSVQFVTQLPLSENPDMILSPALDVVQAASNYVGQDFIVKREPAWSLLLPAEWGRWALFREVVAEQQMVVLWVRDDLFPGAATEQNGNQ
jgi:hypothetical protein